MMNTIRQWFAVCLLVTGCVLTIPGAVAEEETMMETPAEKGFYGFVLNDIDGNPVKMEQFQGKVLLVVNVASKCGFTRQYEGLQNLYAKYKDQGLVILGFPANDFGGQEPGTNEEIKAFCSTRYQVSFPMFSKISVKGDDQHPLFAYLTSGGGNAELAGAISWNFNKFLVDRKGNLIARFGSTDAPEGKKILAAVEEALAE